MFEGSEYAYYAMYLVGFAIMMLVNLKTYKKYDISKKTAVVITLITYVAGVVGAMMMGSMYSRAVFDYGAEGSRVAIFGAVIFTPVFMTVASFIAGKPWRKIMDMLAPGIFIILTCAKFGCFMAGCCAGRECDSGLCIYNPKLELTVFPSQLFESITMCIVVAFCFWYAFKSKKCISGSVYPFTAAVYSVTRFCWEFMRYYVNDEVRHIMFGLTFWQFWCIVVVILSIVWVLLLRSERLSVLDAKAYDFVDTKHKEIKEKIEKFKHRNDKNIVHRKRKKK